MVPPSQVATVGQPSSSLSQTRRTTVCIYIDSCFDPDRLSCQVPESRHGKAKGQELKAAERSGQWWFEVCLNAEWRGGLRISRCNNQKFKRVWYKQIETIDPNFTYRLERMEAIGWSDWEGNIHTSLETDKEDGMGCDDQKREVFKQLNKMSLLRV